MLSRLLSLRRLPYAPFLVQLVTTRRCNLSCGYCNEYDRQSDPVPFETLRDRIRMIQSLGAYSIELTGGEPMLHPDIYDLVRACRQAGFWKTMMISNAFLLREPQVTELNRAGLQELQVSVDGVTPNELTVKVLERLRDRLESLARLAQFKVVMSAVIGSAPADEVLEVIAFAKRHGFAPRVLVLHDDTGQLHLSQENRALYRKVRAAIGRRYTEADDYRTQLLTTGRAPFKCRAGSRYLYVDEHGQALWCAQTAADFALPLERYDYQQLRRQFQTIKPCSEACTVGCARTNSAFDQWRGQRRVAPPVPSVESAPATPPGTGSSAGRGPPDHSGG